MKMDPTMLEMVYNTQRENSMNVCVSSERIWFAFYIENLAHNILTVE